jgi:hypothetical protein
VVLHWCSEYVIPKKARGLPGMKDGPLVQMLDRQRVQQAAAVFETPLEVAAQFLRYHAA